MPSNRSRRADRARRRLGVLLAGEPTSSVPAPSPIPFEVDASPATTIGAGEPVRWRPANLRGLSLLFAVAVLLAGSWWLLSRPRGAPIQVTTSIPAGSGPLSASPTSGPVAPSAGTTSSVAQVVVDVEGRVRRPGIVRLPAGSRVIDALRTAGLRPGVATTSLNLARVLVDGEQLWVGRRPSPTAAGPASGSGDASASTGPVDLNTATVEQLDALPGIGPVLAQRILDWRTAHGAFTSVDQLKDVSGIGDATFADLRSLVTV